MKHDNLGQASVKSESELAEFARVALAKLKEMPEKLQSFFGDPALGYIRGLTTGVQELIFSLNHVVNRSIYNTQSTSRGIGPSHHPCMPSPSDPADHRVHSGRLFHF